MGLHELSGFRIEDIAAIAADLIVVNDISKLAWQSKDVGKVGLRWRSRLHGE